MPPAAAPCVLEAGVPDEVAVPAALVPGGCDTRAVSIDRSPIAPGLRVGSAIGDTGYRLVVPVVGLVFALGAVADGPAVPPEFAAPAAPAADGDAAAEPLAPAEDDAPLALPPADPPVPPLPPHPPPPWANAAQGRTRDKCNA